MKNFSLVVPIAADKSEYDLVMPYVFSIGRDGIMLCVKSILGLNFSIFDRIYFTVLKKHDILYSLKEMFLIQFKRLNLGNKAEVVVLDEPTTCQPDTIMQTIRKKNITGAIMVKDADSYFRSEVISENAICIYPLDALKRVNPQDKSYISIDDGYFITNIIEKKIVSRFFCTGGYIFKSINDFEDQYAQLKKYGYLYMSHIIYAMLLNGEKFRPIVCSDYKDWGTSDDFEINMSWK